MRSWTRTLNLDEAHTLLALTEPGQPADAWLGLAHGALPHQSPPRRREIVRMVREDLLTWTDGRVADGLFLQHYARAGAADQVELLDLAWALTHPLPLVMVEELVEPALCAGDPCIPLSRVDALVEERLHTCSSASLRKTRTVLVGALERVGALETAGTGQHRSLAARRGQPGAAARAYLVARGGAELPRRLTACAVG